MRKTYSLITLFPVSLFLLLFSSLVNPAQTEARPPDHAPAWGYRCRQGDANACARQGRNNNRDNVSNPQQGTLNSGTVLNVRHTGSSAVVFRQNERFPLTLVVDRDIRDSFNQVIIPFGSRIVGEFSQVNGGVRFIARSLELTNGQRYNLNASSDVLSRNFQVASGELGSANVSNAARILLGELLGTRRNSTNNSELIVINPGQEISLVLRSDLRLR